MGAPRASAHFRKQTFWEKNPSWCPHPHSPSPRMLFPSSEGPRRGRPPARVGAKLRLSGPRPPVCGSASRRPAPTSHGSLRGVLSLGVKPNTFFPHLRDAGRTGARTPDGHAAAGGPLSRPSLPAPRAVPAVGTRPRRPFTCGRPAAPPRPRAERAARTARPLCVCLRAPTTRGPGRGRAMPASHGRGRRDPHPHSGSGGPGSPPARGEGAARAPPTRPRGDSAGAGSLRGRPASGGGTVGAESARSSCCALPPPRPPRPTPRPQPRLPRPLEPARVRKRASDPPTEAGHAPQGPPRREPR